MALTLSGQRRRALNLPLKGMVARRTTRGLLARGCGGFACVAVLLASLLAGAELWNLHFDRQGLPDLNPFIRFELPTIGRVYDTGGRPLIELAREYREIARYDGIPPTVRDAILAAEDKRFFSHSGIDYLSLLRVLGKVRVGMLARRLLTGGRHDEADGAALFPQGGSTITQQLVRGTFLRQVTAQENSYQLRPTGLLAAILSPVMGARSINMLARKREEVRLSLWLEEEMLRRFGSKRRAKEEILARYATFVYMGHGQYGFARAAQYYFGRRLSTFTEDDADKAALLAGIAKSPRDYAPDSRDKRLVARRRDETLTLMHANASLSFEATARAKGRAIETVSRDEQAGLQAPAVVGHVLEELTASHADLGVEDLLQGRVQVYATVDARVQHIANDALEHGLARYERGHPGARGVIQGSVVVLQNSDGSILAEVGGRRLFKGRPASYRDYNRATRSLRQPGSAMKPIVYLAAFRSGAFTLDTLVPDEPISVSDGQARPRKWIANYDGRFKGPIPVRQALAESRNAVAIWLTAQIGIDSVLRTSRNLGVQTPLGRYPTTALGASEMTLLELANAYRTMASGITAEPYVIRSVVGVSGELVGAPRRRPSPAPIDGNALSLIQEGMRGVVLLPTGTAHALASRQFPVAVMGKTGTTNEFKDAVFVGSTYGPDGVTVAVRIGFDDNRSLGAGQTGGKLALPVFQELMLGIYRDDLLGAAPAFPVRMENRIAASLLPRPLPPAAGIVERGDSPRTGKKSWRRVFRSEHLPGSPVDYAAPMARQEVPRLDQRWGNGAGHLISGGSTHADATLDSIGDAVLCTDVAGRVTYLNRTAEVITGWSRADAAGRPLRDVFHVVDGDTRARAPDPVSLAVELNKAVVGIGPNCLLVRRDGHEVAIEDSAAPIREGNLVIGVVIVFRDVGAALERSREALYRAQHDALTHLPNRSLLNDYLANAIALSKRHDKPLAVGFLDVDGLKAVNDSRGHSVGDRILSSVASRIRKALRQSDSVGRVGGDEFVIVLSEIAHAEDAALVGQKLLQAVAAPHRVDGRDVTITASLGLALYPDDGLTAEDLIARADVAMYTAKRSGRGTCQFFQDGMTFRSAERSAALRNGTAG